MVKSSIFRYFQKYCSEYFLSGSFCVRGQF
nr:MAG TPA: hypothetical protein [Caudoviricetes sp.]